MAKTSVGPSALPLGLKFQTTNKFAQECPGLEQQGLGPGSLYLKVNIEALLSVHPLMFLSRTQDEDSDRSALPGQAEYSATRATAGLEDKGFSK